MYSIWNCKHLNSQICKKIELSFPLIRTTIDFIDTDSHTLGIELGISDDDINSIKRRILEDSKCENCPISSLINKDPQHKRISTGDTLLDNFLGNSILSQSLTILSGPPGIGKTQFFISIICWCIENGKHVVYISTGCDFVLERVLQILQVHQIKQLEILKLLHIVHLSTYQECISCFEDFEDLFQTKQFGCVLIDSLTWILQPYLSLEFQNGKLLISQLLIFLRTIAHDYQFPILMTNQTRTTLNRQTKNALNFNIYYFMDNKIDLFQSKDSRVLIIDKANESVSPRQINFQITESGFCSISNKMYCDC